MGPIPLVGAGQVCQHVHSASCMSRSPRACASRPPQIPLRWGFDSLGSLCTLPEKPYVQRDPRLSKPHRREICGGRDARARGERDVQEALCTC